MGLLERQQRRERYGNHRPSTAQSPHDLSSVHNFESVISKSRADQNNVSQAAAKRGPHKKLTLVPARSGLPVCQMPVASVRSARRSAAGWIARSNLSVLLYPSELRGLAQEVITC